jgi:hypothetical protein
MTRLKLFGAAALVAASALASPAMAQAIANPGRCGPDANCQNQNMGARTPASRDYQRHVAYRTSRDRDQYSAQQNDEMRYDAMRNGWHDPSWHAASTDGWWTRRDNDPFVWSSAVAAGVVGGAAATADVAVNTAGAIATAPFRNDNTYAYYNDNGWNNDGWNNNWDRRTYAQRNGFVCQPGAWFKGSDGRQHICQ